MAAVWEAGEPIDFQTVMNAVRAAGDEKYVSVSLVAGLDVDLPDLSRFESYVEILLDYSMRRQMRKKLGRFMKEIKENLSADESLGKFFGDLSNEISIIAARKGKDFDIKAETIEAQRLIEEGGDFFIGEPFGRRALGEVINNITSDDLIGIGGRPGMGKSAEIQKWIIGTEGLAEADNHVSVFSTEMPWKMSMPRFLTIRTGINSRKIVKRRCSPAEWKNVATEMQRISTLPIHWYCMENIDQIVKQAIADISRFGTRFVFVDHLHDVTAKGMLSGHKDTLNYASQVLKNRIVNDLGVPVIMALQLNRKSENEGRLPSLADLRECGALEQRCTKVIMPWYDKEKLEDGEKIAPGLFRVVKNRNGETTDIPVVWDGEKISYFEQ